MRMLVVGGASSGKSAFAEKMATNFPGRRVYLATMQPFGSESETRITRHRQLREGKGFLTVERCRDLASLDLAEGLGTASAHAGSGSQRKRANGDEQRDDDEQKDRTGNGTPFSTVLVEDIGNLLANEMFADDGTFEDGDDPVLRVDAGIRHLEHTFSHVIVVTNDVGRDVVPVSAETAAYTEGMGRINNKLAARFDVVVEVTCGIPLAAKGGIAHNGEAPCKEHATVAEGRQPACEDEGRATEEMRDGGWRTTAGTHDDEMSTTGAHDGKGCEMRSIR